MLRELSSNTDRTNSNISNPEVDSPAPSCRDILAILKILSNGASIPAENLHLVKCLESHKLIHEIPTAKFRELSDAAAKFSQATTRDEQVRAAIEKSENKRREYNSQRETSTKSITSLSSREIDLKHELADIRAFQKNLLGWIRSLIPIGPSPEQVVSSKEAEIAECEKRLKEAHDRLSRLQIRITRLNKSLEKLQKAKLTACEALSVVTRAQTELKPFVPYEGRGIAISGEGARISRMLEARSGSDSRDFNLFHETIKLIDQGVRDQYDKYQKVAKGLIERGVTLDRPEGKLVAQILALRGNEDEMLRRVSIILPYLGKMPVANHYRVALLPQLFKLCGDNDELCAKFAELSMQRQDIDGWNRDISILGRPPAERETLKERRAQLEKLLAERLISCAPYVANALMAREGGTREICENFMSHVKAIQGLVSTPKQQSMTALMLLDMPGELSVKIERYKEAFQALERIAGWHGKDHATTAALICRFPGDLEDLVFAIDSAYSHLCARGERLVNGATVAVMAWPALQSLVLEDMNSKVERLTGELTEAELAGEPGRISDLYTRLTEAISGVGAFCDPQMLNSANSIASGLDQAMEIGLREGALERDAEIERKAKADEEEAKRKKRREEEKKRKKRAKRRRGW